MKDEVTLTDMPIYFVIEKTRPVKLLLDCASSEYDEDKSAADRLDGVVTNTSQLRKAGYNITAYEISAKPRSILHKVTVDTKRFKIGFE